MAKTLTIILPVKIVISILSGLFVSSLKKRFILAPGLFLSFSLSRMVKEKIAVSAPEKNAENIKSTARKIIFIKLSSSIFF